MGSRMTGAKTMAGAAQRAARASAWALSASVAAAASVALAGDAAAPGPPPTSAHIGRCGAAGEGRFAASGSDACIRISGYVAADTTFAGALRPPRPPGPFDGPPAPATRASAGVGLDERFDTPMGPGRVYVEIAHDRFER
jgi:hypothetical protein